MYVENIIFQGIHYADGIKESITDKSHRTNSKYLNSHINQEIDYMLILDIFVSHRLT